MPENSIFHENVAIIGGGISGISAAVFLKTINPSMRIDLFEKEERLGGWIRTLNGPYPFELGPRTVVYDRSPYFLKLISLLGLEEKIIFATKSQKRYFCHDNRLLSLPPDVSSILKNPLFYIRLIKSLILEPFQPKLPSDETVFSFFTRRFGRRVGSDLAEALAKGVFGGNCNDLSIKACFPKLKSMEMEGSIIKSLFQKKTPKTPKRGLCNLEGGFETIARTFEGSGMVDIFKNHDVLKIVQDDNSYFLEGIHAGQQFLKRYHHVILALPPKPLLQILEKSSLINSEEAAFLKVLKETTMTIVCVGFDRDCSIPEGFGFLTIRDTITPLLGAVFDSNLFGLNHQKSMVTFMLKGSINEKKAKEIVEDSLKMTLNIHQKPSFIKVVTCDACIPQYPLHHPTLWEGLVNELYNLQGVVCIGTGGDGVALEDLARKGYYAAEKISKRSVAIVNPAEV